MPKNLIINSLKESFSLMQKNKLLLIFLLMIQIIFFMFSFLLTYNYMPKMIESEKAISDYMSKQNLDDISLASDILRQKSILGDDPLTISRNFNEIKRDFRQFMIYFFILLTAFTSLSWAIAHRLNSKKKFPSTMKIFFRFFLKTFIISSFYFGLIFSFFLSILDISFTDIADEGASLLTKYVPFFFISLALFYFMFISLALLENTEMKDIVQRTLSVGIKKIHYIMAVYFINLSLFAVSLILMSYFIEKNPAVLLLGFFLFIFSFIFGRIFMVNVVEKL